MNLGPGKTKVVQFIKLVDYPLFDIPSVPERNSKEKRPTMKTAVPEILDNLQPGQSGLQLISKSTQPQEKGKLHCRIQNSKVTRVDDPQPSPSGMKFVKSQSQNKEKQYYRITDTTVKKFTHDPQPGPSGIQTIKKLKQSHEKGKLHYKENNSVSSQVDDSQPGLSGMKYKQSQEKEKLHYLTKKNTSYTRIKQPGSYGIQNIKFKQSQENLRYHTKKNNSISTQVTQNLNAFQTGKSSVQITSRHKRSQEKEKLIYYTKKSSSVTTQDDPQPGQSVLKTTTKFKQSQEKEKFYQRDNKFSKTQIANFDDPQPGSSGIQETSKYNRLKANEKFHQRMKKDTKIKTKNFDDPQPGSSGIQMTSKYNRLKENEKHHKRMKKDSKVKTKIFDDPQPGPSGIQITSKYNRLKESEKYPERMKKDTSVKTENLDDPQPDPSKYNRLKEDEKRHQRLKNDGRVKIENFDDPQPGPSGIQMTSKYNRLKEDEKRHHRIKKDSKIKTEKFDDSQPGPSGIQITSKNNRLKEDEKRHQRIKKDSKIKTEKFDDSQPGPSGIQITSKYNRLKEDEKRHQRIKKDSKITTENFDDSQPGPSGIQITSKYNRLKEDDKKDTNVKTENFDDPQPGTSGTQMTSKVKRLKEKENIHERMKKESKTVENFDDSQPGPSGIHNTKYKPSQEKEILLVGCSRGKITKIDGKFFSDANGFLEISSPTPDSELSSYKITCDFMDPATKQRRTGEPFDQVPPHRWGTNVICGEGADTKMAHVTGPNKNYLFCSSPSALTSDDGESPGSYDEASCSIPSVPSVPSVPSPDENVPVSEFEDPETSPKAKNKFSKNTKPKSSTKRNENPDPHNDSHVGEQTPHTRDKKEKNVKKPKTIPTVQKSVETVAMRVDAGFSPQPIRVRDIPLPGISWSDHTDLSLLMCFKEDIGLNERSSVVFRRNPNLNTRMRAILFDWLMEVCDVYKLRRVTYYLAIDYIDRYLSRTEIVPKNHLQLLGITCLFIAAKVEEIYPPKLAELAYVTDGACTDTDMLAKEMDILKELRWDVNPMTSTAWLCLYLQLACTKADEIRQMMRRLLQKDDDVIYPQFSPHLFMTASMLLDLCSLDDGMLQFKYSVIASSIIYYILNREKALFVSGYTWENIRPCIEWMYPFAVVVFRTINIKPLVAPREIARVGSALRVSNPNIVLDEGHTVQNHVIDLKMLEDVYNEVKILRQNFKEGKNPEATGWTASEDGYDPACIAIINQRRRAKRKHLRTSSYAQASSRNQLRVHHTANSDHQTSSESDNDPPKTDLAVLPGITPLQTTENRSSSQTEIESPSHSYLRVRYIDEDGNKVSRTYITNNQNGLTEVEGSNLDLDEKCSAEWRKQGVKRTRRDDSDLSDSENDGPPRKRSCSEKKCSCSSMLASPKCSGLYLQEGQRAGFGLRRTTPDPTVVPPAPPKPPVPENYEPPWAYRKHPYIPDFSYQCEAVSETTEFIMKQTNSGKV